MAGMSGRGEACATAPPLAPAPAPLMVAWAALTLALAAAAWVVAVQTMDGMDMGVATPRGELGSFLVLWAAMMAAMMLPGAVPAAVDQVRAGRRGVAVLTFLGSYIAVWALVGVGVYALYRPHGYVAAGLATIAAGAYELTPLKRDCRDKCRQRARSGLELGLRCVGSSGGLMLVLVAVGPMSVTWMALMTVPIVVQKLLPARRAVDIPLAVVLLGLGVLIAVAPSSVPGLMPSVSSMSPM